MKYNTHKSLGCLVRQAAADQLLLRLAVNDCLKLWTAQSEGQKLYGLNMSVNIKDLSVRLLFTLLSVSANEHN